MGSNQAGDSENSFSEYFGLIVSVYVVVEAGVVDSADTENVQMKTNAYSTAMKAEIRMLVLLPLVFGLFFQCVKHN